MDRTNSGSKYMLIASVCIFGTVGIFRRYIPLSSGLIALVRGVLGAAFLLLAGLMRRRAPDWAAIRKNLANLLISGAAIGFNWILLFEAYNYTTVATATLCYYLAPIFVILVSPVVLGSRLTVRKGICAAIALGGMVLVSGVLDADPASAGEWKGILYGIGAAILYACVILTNQKISAISSEDRTIVQLSAAAAALLPYVALTYAPSDAVLTPVTAGLLLITGIVHTGLAYRMYLGSMEKLEAHTVALFSYVDPLLAILLSAAILKEPLTLSTGIGAVMILGAAHLSEK